MTFVCPSCNQKYLIFHLCINPNNCINCGTELPDNEKYVCSRCKTGGS